MYCVLVDIPAFRQICRIAPEAGRIIAFEIRRLALDSGASLVEQFPGRYLISYRHMRAGDTIFMIETFCAYEDVLIRYPDELMGFSLILELVEDNESDFDRLRKLIVQVPEAQGLWLGPIAATQLDSVAKLEAKGPVWKLIERFSTANKDETSILAGLERIQPTEQLVERMRHVLDAGGGFLFLESEKLSDVGNAVERALSSLLGRRSERNYVWVRGMTPDDPPALALSRYIFPRMVDLISAHVPDAIKSDWELTAPFLYQGLHTRWSRTVGKDVFEGMFYPLAHIATAWQIMLNALLSWCTEAKTPAIIYIENADQLPLCTLEILSASLPSFLKQNDCPALIIIGQAEESLRVLSSANNREFWQVARLSPWQIREMFPDRTIPILQGNLDPTEAAFLAWDGIELASDAIMTERDLQRAMVAALPELEREVYFVIHLTQGLFPLHKLTEFLGEIGVEKIRIPGIFTHLYQQGLTRMEDNPVPVYFFQSDELAQIIEQRSAEIRAALNAFILQAVERGDVSVCHDLFHIASDLMAEEAFLVLAFPYAERLIDCMALEEATQVIDHLGAHAQSMTPGLLRERYQNSISYLHCRYLLRSNSTSEILSTHLQLNQIHAKDILNRAYIDLQRARWHYQCHELDQAQVAIKRAIITFQDGSDIKGLAASHTLFGMTLLARERLVEARDYFALGRNTASQGGAVYEETRAMYMELVLMFLNGQYSRVLVSIADEKGISLTVRRLGMTDIQVALQIIRARVYFELGKYRECKDSFRRADELLTGIALGNLRQSIADWIERAGFIETGINDDQYLNIECKGSAERLCFLAEQFLAAGYFEQAIRCLDALPEQPPLDTHPENILAGSVSSMFEGYLFNGTGILMHLVHLAAVYRACAMAQLGQVELAAELLFTRSRSKMYWSTDPYLYYYNYCYSTVLRRLGTNRLDDADTILGKVIKIFQERGSRIEDPVHKQSFLRQRHWNCDLLADARERNLV